MYYELGTMVAIRNIASPFVNHEKGINIPVLDVVGEIISIHPATLSYVVRLSKKYVLTFSDDDIYCLSQSMSSRRDMFHKMLGSVIANAHPFYFIKEFEDFVNSENRLSDRLIDHAIKKYCEHDCRATYEAFKDMNPEYFPGYHFTPARRPLKALEDLNRREFERISASPIRIEIDDMIKANYSKEEIKKMINNSFGMSKYEYKKIIFSGPCTIILWKDGTKTIAKASGGEAFDPEKGVAICFMKKMLGHTETNKVLRKAHKQYEDYIAENGIQVTLFDNIAAFLGDVDEINRKLEEDQDE